LNCPTHFVEDAPNSWATKTSAANGQLFSISFWYTPHDRFTTEDGRMRIQNIQRNDGGIYRCSILLLGIVDSRYITVNVLERDSLAPRIVVPSNPIQVMYGDPLDLICQLEEQRDIDDLDVQYTSTVDTDYEDNHFKNTTADLHRDAYQFLGGRYTCRAVNEYGYDEQVFYVRILGKSIHANNKLNVYGNNYYSFYNCSSTTASTLH
jgi:hypothetical protein